MLIFYSLYIFLIIIRIEEEMKTIHYYLPYKTRPQKKHRQVRVDFITRHNLK